MAITASGMFGLTFKTWLDGTDYILDYINDSIKVALYTNSLAPNFDTDTVYSTTAEHAATGNYVQGGIALATKTLTLTTGTLFIDSDDWIWTPTFTLAAVRGARVYDDTTASKKLVGLVNLGADYAVTAGVFTITLPSGGWSTLDYTP